MSASPGGDLTLQDYLKSAPESSERCGMRGVVRLRPPVTVTVDARSPWVAAEEHGVCACGRDWNALRGATCESRSSARCAPGGATVIDPCVAATWRRTTTRSAEISPLQYCRERGCVGASPIAVAVQARRGGPSSRTHDRRKLRHPERRFPNPLYRGEMGPCKRASLASEQRYRLVRSSGKSIPATSVAVARRITSRRAGS